MHIYVSKSKGIYMQENNIILIKNQGHESVDFNNEYTLPDYIPDVSKLVRCDAKAVLHNVYKNDNSYCAEGEVIYSILVICDDSRINNIIYSEDFSVNCNCAVASDDIVCEVKLENLSSRLLSQRKINCKSRVIVSIKYNSPCNVGTEYCGSITSEADSYTEKQVAKCRYMNIFEAVLSNQHGNRDIVIDAHKEEISNIVYCRVNVYVNERKQIDGRLFLRGDGVVDMLYESSGGNYVKLYDRYPFSDILDIREEADAHMCDVVVSDIKATVRNDGSGGMRCVEIDYTYGIRCKCYSQKESELILDIYSTEYDVECTAQPIRSLHLNNVFASSITLNESVPASDYGDDISIICDSSATVVNTDMKIDLERKKLILNGDVRFDVIYKGNTCGNFSVICPFKIERDHEPTSDDAYCDYNVTVQSDHVTLDKGKIYLKGELYFNVLVADYNSYSYIQNAEFSNIERNEGSSVIVYYPTADDRLWDVAKKYKCTCRDIMTANGLDSENIDSVKVLLLPKKKSKSIYNAII